MHEDLTAYRSVSLKDSSLSSCHSSCICSVDLSQGQDSLGSLEFFVVKIDVIHANDGFDELGCILQAWEGTGPDVQGQHVGQLMLQEATTQV